MFFFNYTNNIITVCSRGIYNITCLSHEYTFIFIHIAFLPSKLLFYKILVPYLIKICIVYIGTQSVKQYHIYDTSKPI